MHTFVIPTPGKLTFPYYSSQSKNHSHGQLTVLFAEWAFTKAVCCSFSEMLLLSMTA